MMISVPYPIPADSMSIIDFAFAWVSPFITLIEDLYFFALLINIDASLDAAQLYCLP